MNKYIILFTVICSLTICNADALTKAAVIDFYGEGISGSTLIVLSDYLRSELMRTGLYDLMDRRYMSQILEEQAFQYSGACTDLGCIVDMGKMLGVTKMFGGTIGKLGTKYMITVKIVDVSTGRIDNMVTEKHMGAEEDLDLSITQIALKLTGGKEDPQKYKSANTEMNTVFRYELEKKDYTKAMFYSVFPGGGHFYTENYYVAVTFIPLRVFALYQTIMRFDELSPNDDTNTILLISLQLIHLTDMFTAPLSAKSYNKKLKQKYNISMHPILDAEGNARIAFTIEF